MLATLTAAAALCAGCGGGSSPDTEAHALTAPAAPPQSSAAPVVADTGPIEPSMMDAEAQAEIASGLQAAAGGGKTDMTVDADAGATDEASHQAGEAEAKAVLPRTVPDAEAGAAAPAPAEDAPPAAPALSAAAPALVATRSGGRAVPAPAAPTSTDGGPTSAAQETTAVRTVRTGDIRLQVEASRPFSSYKWLWGMECGGQKQGAIHIPETGLLGFDLGNGLGMTRFGKVSDPENRARQVLMFRPHMADPLVSGAPRCEMTFSPSFGGKLPVNQDVWFAFGLRLQDWANTADEQILMQWHWSNGSIPVGPFLALALKGGKLQIDSKSNNHYPPSVATTASRTHWSNGPATANTWTYFVIKARISPNPAHKPYLKVWRDGTPVVDYSGPLGYNYPQVTPYVKIGHYQWLGSANKWSGAAATKTILVRTPALIDDTAGLYTEADIRQHVKSR